MSVEITKTIKPNTPEWKALFGEEDFQMHFHQCEVPTEIYTDGDLSALLDPSRPRVVLTGTRDNRAWEPHIILEVVSKLASLPCKPVIISGLAIGTDAHVHKYALELGLPTVAVMPTGLDKIYPFANEGLAERIRNTPGCALLTQFPVNTAPMALNFLARNTTMAMLADVGIVLFSKKKGGSMIVARKMVDLGKPVWAVPGRLDDVNSAGCNDLIRQGYAIILSDVSDLENIIPKTNPIRYGKQS